MTKVNVMYLVQNKIGKVDEGALDWAKDTLTSLELGGNRIRVRVDTGLDVHIRSRRARLSQPSPYIFANLCLCVCGLTTGDREPRTIDAARGAMARKEQDQNAGGELRRVALADERTCHRLAI